MSELFKLDGFYIQDEKIGILDGLLTFENGVLTGPITDLNSPEQQRTIQGQIKEQRKSMQLCLLVSVPDKNLTDIQYRVYRKGKSIEGTYTGKWIPQRRINNFQVTGLEHETWTGQSYFPGKFDICTPHEKDMKPQPAQITLRKIA